MNGEEKFPELLQALRNAKDHIHIEYYIFEDDEIGRSIEDVLIEKANEGIAIRFIYDDFGSRSLRKRLVKRLRANGIAASPFFEINFIAFANRINYRNHRKIIIIDGRTGFVGGINVSDKYINKPGDKKRYWRDTHLRIDGPGVHQLQYLFLCDWNFCAHENLSPNGASVSYTHLDVYKRQVFLPISKNIFWTTRFFIVIVISYVREPPLHATEVSAKGCFTFITMLIPVSYTHLDVYKRQVVDIASLRAEIARKGKNPDDINPLIPVDLIIDHSVQVDYFGTDYSYARNMDEEYKRRCV